MVYNLREQKKKLYYTERTLHTINLIKLKKKI